MQLQLCTVFFTFSLGTRTHYFGRTILHGGAKVGPSSHATQIFLFLCVNLIRKSFFCNSIMQLVGDLSLSTSSLQRIIGSTPAVISLRGISLSLCKAYGVQKVHALVFVCWYECMHAHVHTFMWSSFVITEFCPCGISNSFTNL